jgi:hypothetical protein
LVVCELGLSSLVLRKGLCVRRGFFFAGVPERSGHSAFWCGTGGYRPTAAVRAEMGISSVVEAG